MHDPAVKLRCATLGGYRGDNKTRLSLEKGNALVQALKGGTTKTGGLGEASESRAEAEADGCDSAPRTPDAKTSATSQGGGNGGKRA